MLSTAMVTMNPSKSQWGLQECYTSLVENLNISDVQCLKYSLSKGLGIGIVVGGSVMKVPQLLLSKRLTFLNPRTEVHSANDL